MACTDTGLKMCTLLSVDTLKPLWANIERRNENTWMIQNKKHLLTVLPLRFLTHLHPGVSRCRSTRAKPAQQNRNCRIEEQIKVSESKLQLQKKKIKHESELLLLLLTNLI